MYRVAPLCCCRYSSPFFYNPSYETDYEPVSGTVSPETPAKYSRINWGDFRLARFAGDYAGQRSEVQELYTLQYHTPCISVAVHQCNSAAVVLVVGATVELLRCWCSGCCVVLGHGWSPRNSLPASANRLRHADALTFCCNLNMNGIIVYSVDDGIQTLASSVASSLSPLSFPAPLSIGHGLQTTCARLIAAKRSTIIPSMHKLGFLFACLIC